MVSPSVISVILSSSHPPTFKNRHFEFVIHVAVSAVQPGLARDVAGAGAVGADLDRAGACLVGQFVQHGL